MSSLRRLVYSLRVLYPHGTSAKPAHGATIFTSLQSSEVVAAAAVADSGRLPVLVFVLAAVATAAVVDPRV